MGKKNDQHFSEAFGEGAEALLDLALNNEAIKAVPVVGTFFKVLKGVEDYRSRALTAKLRKFLEEPRLRSAVEAETFRREILEDAGRDQEIGETLFLTLENFNDLTKPVLLARAYASYLIGSIDAYAVEAIAHILNVAFLRDVLAFLELPQRSNDMRWKERLAALGLLRSLGENWDDEVMGYEETPLGATFAHGIGRIEIDSN